MNIEILRDVVIDGKKVRAGSVIDAGLVKDGLKYLLGSKMVKETTAKVCEVKVAKASTKKTAKSTAASTAKNVEVVEETAAATAEEAEATES